MGFFDWLLRRGPSDPRRSTTFAFRRKLISWLLIANISESRRFLENNLDLVRPESEQLLTNIIRRFPKKSQIEMPEAKKTILHRGIVMGGTRQAVRDAYIDEFSALVPLDLPPWLALISNSINFLLLRSTYENNDSALTLIGTQSSQASLRALLPDALSRVRNDNSLSPEILASLQFLLGGLLVDEENPISAIEVLTEAASVFCLRRFPKKFAQVRMYLGLSYFQKMQLTRDTESDDVLCAIVCLEDALRSGKPEEDIGEWDQLMRRLCACYAAIEDYDRVRQLRNEILSTLSSIASPEYFQRAQASLEFLQEREYIENMIELSSPQAAEMMRERSAWERNSRLSELERVRVQFAQLCKNG